LRDLEGAHQLDQKAVARGPGKERKRARSLRPKSTAPRRSVCLPEGGGGPADFLGSRIKPIGIYFGGGSWKKESLLSTATRKNPKGSSERRSLHSGRGPTRRKEGGFREILTERNVPTVEKGGLQLILLTRKRKKGEKPAIVHSSNIYLSEDRPLPRHESTCRGGEKKKTISL